LSVLSMSGMCGTGPPRSRDLSGAGTRQDAPKGAHDDIPAKREMLSDSAGCCQEIGAKHLKRGPARRPVAAGLASGVLTSSSITS